MTMAPIDDDGVDAAVDTEIMACLDPAAPRSFFLFAGAGSGKTHTLVEALKHVCAVHGPALRLRGRRVAVVTYTKAARDEIIRRTQFDPLIAVSTIHSFAWSLVEGFDNDIREWVRLELKANIADLIDKESKGRLGTKASRDRIADIASKERRLANLDTVRRFVYSPDGDNRGRDSLNHSEVLKLAATFLRTKPTLQKIVRDGYPFILVDESQDTNKLIVAALFELEVALRGEIVIGLIGDMMQRIYGDGEPTLGQALPPEWATPIKKLNRRCPRRVIRLINKVREATDRQAQVPLSTATEGQVRLFILPSIGLDKAAAEAAICIKMAEVADDPEWTNDDAVKVLILEHHMASRRLGFETVFEALSKVQVFRTGLLNGELPLLRVFTEQVLGLIQARADKFAIGRIVRDHSPLTSAEAFRSARDEGDQLRKAQAAVDSLLALLEPGRSATVRDVARHLGETRLFPLHERIRIALDKDAEAGPVLEADEDEPLDVRSEIDAAVDAFLDAPFSEMEPYARYVAGRARFDTHQGVKGLEFERVMVIMDDTEARGFQFKYEKLFGPAGADDAVAAATRRLFYVTCSRAEQSLALVAYTPQPDRIRDYVNHHGWFDADEVIIGVPQKSEEALV